jgi:dTDP-4-amino-4,6-dideoxygalactose transaminase
LPTRQKGEVYFEYVIFAKQRDKLFEYLNVCGIEVKKSLKTPVYRQKAITDIFGITPLLKEAEKQQKETLYLPCHQFLSIEEMEYIIKSIKEFYK